MKVTTPLPMLGDGVTITYDDSGVFGDAIGEALKGTALADAPPGIGSNSDGIAADRLRSVIERVERLEEERKALGADIKDIFLEAKSAGFDVKVIKRIIRLRKMEPAQVEEEEALLEVYKRALGM